MLAARVADALEQSVVPVTVPAVAFALAVPDALPPDLLIMLLPMLFFAQVVLRVRRSRLSLT